MFSPNTVCRGVETGEAVIYRRPSYPAYPFGEHCKVDDEKSKSSPSLRRIPCSEAANFFVLKDRTRGFRFDFWTDHLEE